MADGSDGEGAGESCWPAPASGHGSGGGGVQLSDVRREIYDRMRAVGNQEALADPFFDREPSTGAPDLPNQYEHVLLWHELVVIPAQDNYASFFQVYSYLLRQGLYTLMNSNGEFKGLDERLMEDLSLGRRKGIDDFEAISARHCLWILGNAMTPRGSGSIWGELVQDAMERRCLFDYVWHECFSF
ncbi:helicase SEN1-like [Hordeum vulgare]|nr:helicase SEN1-like [Hordeum vulgare]